MIEKDVNVFKKKTTRLLEIDQEMKRVPISYYYPTVYA